MGEAFGDHVGDLVTRDYLDARFAEQDARIEQRFQEQDARFEQRFMELDARFDRRFNDQDNKFHRRFNEQTASIKDLGSQIAVMRAEMLGYFKLHSWMLALLSAAILGPIAIRVGEAFLAWAY